MSSNTTTALLKINDVADQLCVSEATAWRMLRRGQLPRIKVGAVTRVPADAVAQYVADQLPEPARRTRRRSD